jgi:hypothetical protein
VSLPRVGESLVVLSLKQYVESLQHRQSIFLRILSHSDEMVSSFRVDQILMRIRILLFSFPSFWSNYSLKMWNMYNRMKLPYFGLNVSLGSGFGDVYFGSGSVLDPAKSFGSPRNYVLRLFFHVWSAMTIGAGCIGTPLVLADIWKMIVCGAPHLLSCKLPVIWALQTGNGNTLKKRRQSH